MCSLKGSIQIWLLVIELVPSCNQLKQWATIQNRQTERQVRRFHRLGRGGTGIEPCGTPVHAAIWIGKSPATLPWNEKVQSPMIFESTTYLYFGAQYSTVDRDVCLFRSCDKPCSTPRLTLLITWSAVG